MKKGIADLEGEFNVKINALSMQESDFNLRRKKDDQEIKSILKSKRTALLGRL
jgi:hypothetical protein